MTAYEAVALAAAGVAGLLAVCSHRLLNQMRRSGRPADERTLRRVVGLDAAALTAALVSGLVATGAAAVVG